MPIRLETIERLHFGLLAAAVCAAYLSGWFGAGSVLFGGAVMALNFWLLKQMARRLVTPGRERRAWIVPVLMIGKFSVFLGLLSLLFWRVPLDPMGFAVGATVLLVACVVAALRAQAGGASAAEAVGAQR